MSRFFIALAALMLPAAPFAAPSLLPQPAEPDFLPVDEAFRMLPVERQQDRVIIVWDIAPGYYLYRPRLSFEVIEPSGLTLGAPVLPRGVAHDDAFFGQVEIYRRRLHAELPLPASMKEELTLKIGYQGCADAGLCYPPQSQTVRVAP